MGEALTHAASIKRLRAKMVVLVGVVTAVVIVVAFSIVVWVQHSSNVGDIYESLEATLSSTAADLDRAQNMADARPPDAPDTNGTPPSGDTATNTDGTSQTQDTSQSQDTDGKSPAIGRWRNNADALIPVALFYVHADGTYTYMSAVSTASLDTTDTASVIKTTSESADTRGFLATESLYFAKREAAGGTLVALADGAAANNWQGLAATLALVGAAIIALAIVAATFFTRWALRPVEAAWARQQRFIADASHELKTPLSVILANTAIVLERPGDTVSDQATWIESTQTQAARMQTLVREMLELAQADAGVLGKGKGEGGARRRAGFRKNVGRRAKAGAKSRPEARCDRTAIDFSDLVEGCALTFEPLMYEAGVQLQTQIEPGIRVHVNAERATRMVSILLDNAAKYTTCGGQVKVKLTQVDSRAHLDVSNTSEPLTKDQLAHVFERFYKTDASRSAHTSFGLGLAIAQEIAQAAGGRIEAEAAPDVPGNTFTIILPCE